MKRITYGAEGYMDWSAEIPAGASRIKVHFTGGALTAYGVTPAEYTTSNPFFQKVIENSHYFKSGRIKIVRCIEVEDPHPVISQAVETPQPQAQGTQPEPEDEAEPQQTEPRVVEVSCVQDAQEWLTANLGIPARKVRTRAQIQEAGAQNGVEFKWPQD